MKAISGEAFNLNLGLPGSGKTISMVEERIIPALLQGVDVWVNFWINWSGSNIHFFKEFSEVAYVRNCIVVFDEIQRIIDPRHWEGEDSAVRDFFSLHRHRHVDIESATQHLSLCAKTALIEVDRFLMHHKFLDGWLLHGIWRNFPWLCINEVEMSLRDVKLLDSEFIVHDDAEGFSPSDSNRHFYSKKKLLHQELNGEKVEFIHMFCPACNQRQGRTIPTLETYDFALQDERNNYIKRDDVDLGFCPKHKKVPLVLRESGMYDSDYELPISEKHVIFKPFAKVYKEAPFKGSLSADQIRQKRELENKFSM